METMKLRTRETSAKLCREEVQVISPSCWVYRILNVLSIYIYIYINMYNPIPVYSIYFVIFYNLNTETCYPYICIVHIHKLLYFLSHITQQQMDPISRGLEANRRGGTQSRSSGHQVTKATLGFSTHLLVLIHFEQIRKCFKGCQQSLTLSFGFWCWDLEVMPPCPLGLQCYRHGQGMKGVDGLPCHHIQGCVHGHVFHL